MQGVPTNELHACGYVSIGCEPCTRAVLPNQHEREGRWWWEVCCHSSSCHDVVLHDRGMLVILRGGLCLLLPGQPGFAYLPSSLTLSCGSLLLQMACSF